MSRSPWFAASFAAFATSTLALAALPGGLSIASPSARQAAGGPADEERLSALAPWLARLSLLAPPHVEQGGPRCRPVIGKLEEDRATTGCRAPATTCFFGQVHGLGLTASTYFNAETAVQGPSTSPGWVAYSGVFEYTTARGTLKLRETGVSNPTTGNPESGAITAHQRVLEGTGEWAGATGYLFVSGFNIAGHVETTVLGELCAP